MKKTKAAAQLFNLRDYCTTVEGFRDSLKKVSDMGYKAVQFSGIKAPMEAQQIRDYVDENGLEIVVTHISFDDMVNDTENVIKKHKIMGCSHPGIGGMPKYARESMDGMKTFLENIKKVGNEFRQAGLHFVYHNHSFEFAKFDGNRTIMDILFEETDPKDMQFELDLHWVQTGGASPLDWIYKVKGRMDIVHFKDYIVTLDGERRFAPIGQGNLNWESIIKACNKTGVKYAPVEQDLCYDKSPFDCLEESLRFMQSMGMPV